MDLQLRGKTALVTGASAGIGTGIALSLAKEGARLVIAGRNEKALEDVAKQIVAAGGTAPALAIADLATQDGPARVADAALRAVDGRIDILVNNAGGSRPLKGDEDDAFWEEAFNLNFVAARKLTGLVVPATKEARFGRILNVTGALGGQRQNAASAAKAALTTWSRALAFELGPFGITVNMLAPGRINSVQILTRLHPTEQSRADYIKQNIPAGYFGDPEDVGNLAAFLASPLARYISGVAIPVDGGGVRIAL
jgi:3-oxoacyl-[acyl-carrier protein] reductase